MENVFDAFEYDPHMSLFKQRFQKQTKNLKTLSISDVVLRFVVRFRDESLINMRYFQTQGLATLFCSQHNESHINNVDWVFIALGLFLDWL